MSINEYVVMPKDSLWQVLVDITDERGRQDEKWGKDRSFQSVGEYSLRQRTLPTNLDSRVLELLGRRVMTEVLTEEVGEVARASLEENPEQMELEAIHVAAVAVQIVQMLRGLKNDS